MVSGDFRSRIGQNCSFLLVLWSNSGGAFVTSGVPRSIFCRLRASGRSESLLGSFVKAALNSFAGFYCLPGGEFGRGLVRSLGDLAVLKPNENIAKLWGKIADRRTLEIGEVSKGIELIIVIVG